MVAVTVWKYWHNTDAIQVNRKQSPWKWLPSTLHFAKFNLDISLTLVSIIWGSINSKACTIYSWWLNQLSIMRFEVFVSQAADWRLSCWSNGVIFLYLCSERQRERESAPEKYCSWWFFHVFGIFCRYRHWKSSDTLVWCRYVYPQIVFRSIFAGNRSCVTDKIDKTPNF